MLNDNHFYFKFIGTGFFIARVVPVKSLRFDRFMQPTFAKLWLSFMHGSPAMSNYDDQNVFAKILRGELPCTKVYEDDHTLAFMDIMPQVDGHTLVIPKYPATTLFDLPTELAGHLLASVQKVGQAVKIAMQRDGIVIMQLNDKSAGQTVFHLHFHIMPTSLGALSRQSHAQTMGDPAVIQQCADRIKAALATL